MSVIDSTNKLFELIYDFLLFSLFLSSLRNSSFHQQLNKENDCHCSVVHRFVAFDLQILFIRVLQTR